jgi:hypothetical protein
MGAAIFAGPTTNHGGIFMARSNAQRADESDEQPGQRGGRPPVEKFQEGPIQVSIWQNPSSKGDFRTATMERRYKGKDEQFHTSSSYTASDLEHLEKAAAEARARITRWQEESKSP